MAFIDGENGDNFMTEIMRTGNRQENFASAANEYSHNEAPACYHTFIDGAEYGYNYAIDKACEWLTNYFVNYLQFDKQIINDFRKAMED